MDSLVSTVRIFSEGIKTEFVLPRGKVVKSERIRMAYGKMMKNMDKRILKVNSRAVSIVRHGAEIISWTKIETEELDRKTRKLMTMYGTHHPRGDVVLANM